LNKSVLFDAISLRNQVLTVCEIY